MSAGGLAPADHRSDPFTPSRRPSRAQHRPRRAPASRVAPAARSPAHEGATVCPYRLGGDSRTGPPGTPAGSVAALSASWTPFQESSSPVSGSPPNCSHLHDRLAQDVAGLVFQLEAVNAHLSAGRSEQAKAIVQQAMAPARAALRDTRAAIDDLRAQQTRPPERAPRRGGATLSGRERGGVRVRRQSRGMGRRPAGCAPGAVGAAACARLRSEPGLLHRPPGRDSRPRGGCGTGELTTAQRVLVRRCAAGHRQTDGRLLACLPGAGTARPRQA